MTDELRDLLEGLRREAMQARRAARAEPVTDDMTDGRDPAVEAALGDLDAGARAALVAELTTEQPASA